MPGATRQELEDEVESLRSTLERARNVIDDALGYDEESDDSDEDED